MADAGIDYFIVFSKDAHLSEYTGDCDRYRAVISGFTGSAGTLVVSADEAFLWTDMRYHIQAERQLSGTGISLMKYGLPGVASFEDYICDHIWDGMTVAFDFMTASYEKYTSLAGRLPKSVSVIDGHDILISSADMPKRVFEGISCVPVDKAGVSVSEKLAKLRETVRKRYVNDESYTYIMSDLTSIMWLFNLRGRDIDYVPVAYSYAAITEYEATLYIARRKLSKEASENLEEQGARTSEYSTFYESLRDTATDIVLADPFTNSCRVIKNFDEEGIYRECDDTVLIRKAVKNGAETEGMKSSHIKDAVTMIKFLRRIKELAAENDLPDEYSAGAMLDDMRLHGGCSSLSFETICAYGDNAAIVHYGVRKETSKKLEPKGFLLVDSGGQYQYEGTTDITRTIPLGPLTDEEKRGYTAVLIGNLRLMNMVFPAGCEGTLLDAIAEQSLWENGYYCGHGIGHGVGCNLSVHESEARIGRRTQEREITIRPGVVVSNEPGVYIEGSFGVRLENLLLTVPDKPIDGHPMCRFEALTLVPFDSSAVDLSMMSEKEISFLKGYHHLIWETVSPHLDESDRMWLKEYIDIA